jgi:hypothetical protein
MAQDSSDSEHQIEKEERRRDDQDETGRDHSCPQSSCQFANKMATAGTVLLWPSAYAEVWLLTSLRGVAIIANSTEVLVLTRSSPWTIPPTFTRLTLPMTDSGTRDSSGFP